MDVVIERCILRQMIKRYLPQLRPRHREAIELYFIEDLFQWQVAKRMGISQPAVAFLLSRARVALKELFVADGITSIQDFEL